MFTHLQHPCLLPTRVPSSRPLLQPTGLLPSLPNLPLVFSSTILHLLVYRSSCPVCHICLYIHICTAVYSCTQYERCEMYGLHSVYIRLWPTGQPYSCYSLPPRLANCIPLHLWSLPKQNNEQFISDAHELLVQPPPLMMPNSWGSAAEDSPIHSLPLQRRRTNPHADSAQQPREVQQVPGDGDMPMQDVQGTGPPLLHGAATASPTPPAPPHQACALPAPAPPPFSYPCGAGGTSFPDAAARRPARVKRQRSFFDLEDPSEVRFPVFC
jgi:hypothetical protein